MTEAMKELHCYIFLLLFTFVFVYQVSDKILSI